MPMSGRGLAYDQCEANPRIQVHPVFIPSSHFRVARPTRVAVTPASMTASHGSSFQRCSRSCRARNRTAHRYGSRARALGRLATSPRPSPYHRKPGGLEVGLTALEQPNAGSTAASSLEQPPRAAFCPNGTARKPSPSATQTMRSSIRLGGGRSVNGVAAGARISRVICMAPRTLGHAEFIARPYVIADLRPRGVQPRHRGSNAGPGHSQL